MKTSHIDLLCCLECSGALNISKVNYCSRKNDTIELGVLSCINCGTLYPIINGVCVFFPEELMAYYLNEQEKEVCRRLGLDYSSKSKDLLNKNERKQLDVSKNWSYQWNEVCNYSRHDLEEEEGYFSEKLFFKFIPIQPSSLNGKTVVIWGGGGGRDTYHTSKYKPAILILNEIGHGIYRTSKLVPDNVNLLLIRSDMANNPVIDGFTDYSICDHALQHISNHTLGFERIVHVLKPEGIAAICVYSYENNFLVTHIMEPLKVFIHKLPLSIQRIIAILPAIIIFFLIHCIYVQAKKVFSEKYCKRLPLFEHMGFWSKGNFSFVWTACFDLIHAPISYHFKKYEIQELAKLAKVNILALINTHGTTWSMVAQKYIGRTSGII